MTQDNDEPPPFTAGIKAAGLAATLFLTALYVVFVPADEFRARFTFMAYIPSFMAWTWGSTMVLSCILLAIQRRLARRALLGAAVGSVSTVLVPALGLYVIIPEFAFVWTQAVVGGLVLIAVGVMTWLGRREPADAA